MPTSATHPPLLDLRNICVMRGARLVLRDLNLQVHQDEHVAILGPNGCGKSTLVKTITRDCYPLALGNSRMTILGQERWNVFELRSLLGIVSNDLMVFLTGEASALEVVLSGFFSSAGVPPHCEVTVEQRDAALGALDQLQIAQLADQSISEMSSGEARRVLIARALVHAPRTLLFDEPSNSLDFMAHESLRQSMRTLAQAGIGLVLVTHDLSDIIPEISRVLLMSQGQIVADGRKEEVLQSDSLSRLFGAKVEITRRNGHYYLL